jgi:phenylacetate-coenzyme A ligase PaaK-like adenylate-forming protein
MRLTAPLPNLLHPADDASAGQLAALRHYLEHVVLPFTPHYRDLWKARGIEPGDLKTWEDWARVPFTSKADLLPTAERPDQTRRFVVAPDEAALRKRPGTIARALVTGRERTRRALSWEFRPVMLTSTTGRSSDPVPFVYTAHDVARLRESGRRIMEHGASRREWRHLNVFPFAPHLGFWQVYHAADAFGAFCLHTGGGRVMGTTATVAMLAKLQPEVLVGMPTFVYHLLQEAAATGAKLPKLAKIVLGGEKVPEGMRRKLRDLGAETGAGRIDVQATYAFTEAKMAWIECPTPEGAEPGGYHLSPDLGLVEIIDPETGRPVGEGEPGEIVFTPIDARGSVVLRYRTGDRIEGGLVHGACPHCGRTVPRLVGRISRVSEVRSLRFDKIKGTLVNFNDLEHVLDEVPGVGAWQLEIRKRHDDPLECDELVVHLHRTGSGSGEALRRVIEDRFFLATEIRPNRIEFHDAEEMRVRHGVGTALKEEKIVDRRPRPDGRS